MSFQFFKKHNILSNDIQNIIIRYNMISKKRVKMLSQYIYSLDCFNEYKEFKEYEDITSKDIFDFFEQEQKEEKEKIKEDYDNVINELQKFQRMKVLNRNYKRIIKAIIALRDDILFFCLKHRIEIYKEYLKQELEE